MRKTKKAGEEDNQGLEREGRKERKEKVKEGISETWKGK